MIRRLLQLWKYRRRRYFQRSGRDPMEGVRGLMRRNRINWHRLDPRWVLLLPGAVLLWIAIESLMVWNIFQKD